MPCLVAVARQERRWAEVFRAAGQGPHATGDLLPEFDHADFPFGGVVVERKTATERTSTTPSPASHPPSQTQGKSQLAAAHSARFWSSAR
jgi:hypothetical protein